VANYLIPGFLIALLPIDLVAGLVTNQWPTQATLMVAGGFIIGLYLARRLWGGKARQIESLSRLQLVGQQGVQFDPTSEEAQIQLENARTNYFLGAGLLTFGILFNFCFIASYLFVTPIAVTPSATGQAIQLGMLLLFTFLVLGAEVFGAKVFLKR
jgi:hypothetical protein